MIEMENLHVGGESILKKLGWQPPPPKNPCKSKDDFIWERQALTFAWEAWGYPLSERLKAAMLEVPREDFVPMPYRDYAHQNLPLPLPGESTISGFYLFFLAYELLGLDRGHRFLDVGTGSGYGAALAWELVGPSGAVISIEIDPETFTFGKNNLARLGYSQIILINGDGTIGHSDMAPYDSILFTGTAPEIPPPLMAQMKVGGRLIGGVGNYEDPPQLVLTERQGPRQWNTVPLMPWASHLPMKGQHGMTCGEPGKL